MKSPTSSVSTAWSFGEYFAHTTWNPLLELLSLEQTTMLFSVPQQARMLLVTGFYTSTERPSSI